MAVTLLFLFIVVVGTFMSLGLQSDKLAHPVFRKAFPFELLLYLAALAAVLLIAHQLFGTYVSWVGALLNLVAIPFARKGYPNLLRFWRERDNYVR